MDEFELGRQSSLMFPRRHERHTGESHRLPDEEHVADRLGICSGSGEFFQRIVVPA
jgi:hypothetical protein